jgi:histidyl-tRNA synthetase
LYAKIGEVSREFGYQEWDGPILEKIDLYAAKSGEELVKQQAFVFPDKSGGLITLRPELTPSLARMVAQKQGELSYPLRWWSFGPFWRYEAPQKGRTREFFQWNIDLIGTTNPESDAELVAVAASFFQKVGLRSDQVKILVNNRKLVEAILAGLDIAPELRKDTLRFIDRRDKLSPAAWDAYAGEIGLSAAQLDGIKAFLQDKAAWQQSPELSELFTLVEALGLKDYVAFAPHIMRGLDYYTGTVFEAWDTAGEFRAVLGGGRYDNLVSDVGGDPLPAVGFAMGDLVISLVLKKFGTLPADLAASPAKVLVTVFDAAGFPASFQLAARLRQQGVNAAVYPEAAKLGKQFKYGDRMGMHYALVLGPDEVAQGLVTLKDLRTGEQKTVRQDELHF